METLAIILAAGRGSRMGAGDPKQYRLLGGKPVIARTLEAFLVHPDVDAVLPVIHADDEAAYREALSHVGVPAGKLLDAVTGGATRQKSALLGLRAAAPLAPQRVLIHDAARPFCDGDVISAVIGGIAQGRGSLPVLAVSDTLKRGKPDATGHITIGETVDRTGLYAAQTPQGFPFAALLAAHETLSGAGIVSMTDDALVAESGGTGMIAVAGSPANVKITTQADLELAERRLAAGASPSLPDVRTGNGYDVHRLVPGDGVMLCGVQIAHDQSLDGHSDADVGLHALTDALLGTVGEGDIGSHFPPSDPQWKGASSDRFLDHACGLVRAAGGIITLLDVTLICEAPKIGPHRDRMREAIAGICGITPHRVSVKATTNEAIGFVGRREGIAAIATATVVFGHAGTHAG